MEEFWGDKVGEPAVKERGLCQSPPQRRLLVTSSVCSAEADIRMPEHNSISLQETHFVQVSVIFLQSRACVCVSAGSC